MSVTDAELERYARVVADVAVGVPLEEALATSGLDEGSFDTLEARVEAALADALAESGEAPGPFVLRYERALREAQATARGGQPAEVLPLDRFGEALATLSTSADPVKALESLGLTPQALIAAAGAHAASLATRPDLVAVLERSLAPRRGR